jgi:DNA helicase HerA-like ATPase
MANLELFPSKQIVGVFRGFREGGLEFHADLALPYRNDFQSIPMHGQFLLVQLETTEEAVLGRITSFSSEGKLSGGTGEEFNIRAVRENRPIPEDLREQYLKYRVNIRVLGVIRKNKTTSLTFVPSHRRLPHVGSSVAFPSDEVLCEIAGHNIEGGAEIGHFALGEYIYAKSENGVTNKIDLADWMQIKSPEILIKFPVENLVSRRSFIFARAGFGKSNLNKLLFSKLYEKTPTVTKRGEKKVPVGTIIFDPDGEYFWPDDKGRPGLCDVPALQDKLVVFTPRKGPSQFYESFVSDGIKLDIRRLRPSDVIAIALSPEKQDQQNIRKLKGLDQTRWEKLVNLIDKDGNQADLEELRDILSLDERQDIEAVAARANMTTIVRGLHDKGSQLMDKLLEALKRGKLCIVDVSQMRGGQSLILSGLILRKIFDRNQQEFTAAEPDTIPTIAVVEEAQSVLNEKAAGAEPYITWVKEGRKYDLGALMVTQQPGSIPVEILSQGDNWFIFHLLSSSDLMSVKRANAHFSEDLLSALLNEPIPGQGVFWSSVGGKPYPVAIRALSFEKLFTAIDPQYNKPAIETFASQLKQKYQNTLVQASRSIQKTEKDASNDSDSEQSIEWQDDKVEEQTIDALEVFEANAIQALSCNQIFLQKVKDTGIRYGQIKYILKDALPETLEDRDQRAYGLIPKALNEILGPRGKEWHTFKDSEGKLTVKAGKE